MFEYNRNSAESEESGTNVFMTYQVHYMYTANIIKTGFAI